MSTLFAKVFSLALAYLRAFAIIYFCLLAGTFITYLLPLTIPGSVVGLFILFILLTTGLVQVHWVNPGYTLLARNMPLLFVPVSVGVIDHFDLILAQFGPIIVACVVSTLLVISSVGYIANLVLSRQVNND